MWHLPRGESIPAIEKDIWTLGVSIKHTAEAKPSEHSPRASALRAQLVTTIPVEQAVSTEKHGPLSPKAKESRPDAIDEAIAYGLNVRPHRLAPVLLQHLAPAGLPSNPLSFDAAQVSRLA